MSLPASPQSPSVTQPVESPELLELARQTILRHPEVLAARAAVDASHALQIAAERPLFNPEIDIAFEDRLHHETRIFALNQTVDIAGQRGARASVAAHDSERAVSQLTAARRRIAGEFLDLLGDYWTADSQDELAETRIDLMRSFADLTLRRRQAGDLTQVELNSANLAYAQAEMAHATAESARTAADQALRAVAAAPPPASWPTLPVELQPIAADGPLLERLLGELPENRIRRAEAERAAATVELRVRERRANPILSVGVGEEDDEGFVTFNVSMPLNIRNRYVQEVAAARAEQTMSEREAENIEVRTRQRLFAARERYRLTREAWMSWRQSGEPSLTRQAELLERLVLAGELSTTDYLVQLNQTLDAAMNALELRRELWRSWFEWLDASGQTNVWLGLDTGVAR
ncbi:MAG: TolC family protein [Rhodospirillaceae bacterium]|nr:TolC family protein [Rhodospirillaceae bacterium]